MRRRWQVWLLWLIATVDGLLFLDVFVTKLVSGDTLAYVGMFAYGGGAVAAALAANARSGREHERS